MSDLARTCECGCGVKVAHRFVQGHNSKREGVPPSSMRPEPNPSGLCMCGCGKTTTIATMTHFATGRIKGKHTRFVMGHQSRLRIGEASSQWKGGRIITDEGYSKVRVFTSDRRAGRYVLEHRVVMAGLLGRPLAKNEEVHHIDGDKLNNAPENLELWHRSQPNGIRVSDYHCVGCCCPK